MRLYTVQHQRVVEAIRENGSCFSDPSFIRRKYGESAPIFLAAYQWLAGQMGRYAPKPPGAVLPYWAFANQADFERFADSRVLTLEVPPENAVFFDMFDWNEILKLQYLTQSEEDGKRFRSMLQEQGIRQESDIVLTGFYPDLRREMESSWQRLFRHHTAIAVGENPVSSIQAALWQIRDEWIIDTE